MLGGLLLPLLHCCHQVVSLSPFQIVWKTLHAVAAAVAPAPVPDGAPQVADDAQE